VSRSQDERNPSQKTKPQKPDCPVLDSGVSSFPEKPNCPVLDSGVSSFSRTDRG
jgi:hypothetical protein